MEVPMLDVAPLLITLCKVSGQRVIPDTFDVMEDKDFSQVSIPVGAPNLADRTEQALRKYSKDWIRKQGRNTVDAKYLPCRGRSWYDDDGTETPLSGIIILSWWPKPELTELEQWEKDKYRRKKERESERS